MPKHLTPVGNSLAFVIEKPILSLLGIRRKTLLRLLIDGRRIILEPVPDEPETSTAQRTPRQRTFRERTIDAEVTLDELCVHQVGSYFSQLGEGLNVPGYRDELSASRHNARARELLAPRLDRIMTRLEVCHGILETGRSWSEAIAAALASCPIPSCPIRSEQASGDAAEGVETTS